jgi:colicin import membrane protein
VDPHLRRLGRPVRAVMLAIAVHVVLLVLLGLGFYFQPTVIQPTAAVPMNAVAVNKAVLDVARQKKDKAKKDKAKKDKAKKDKAKKDKAKKDKAKKDKAKKDKAKKEKAKKDKAKKEKAEREKERQLQEQREVEEAHQRDQTQAYSAIGALVGRIGAKVRENWNKPPGTMTGLETVISVKVERTGEVVSVKVVKSSGNDYFDQSAENAVYKASPLPFPDEPRYYEFIKEFNFKFVPDRD